MKKEDGRGIDLATSLLRGYKTFHWGATNFVHNIGSTFIYIELKTI